MKKESCALILSALILTACGGGGGGGGGAPALVRTTISGNVTPPLAPASGTVLTNATVLTPPNSTGTWSSIVQGANYTYDPAGFNAVPAKYTVTSMTISQVDTLNGSTSITTGAKYQNDAALGQTTAILNTLAGTGSWGISQLPGGPILGILTPDYFGTGLASVGLVGQLANTTTTLVAEYAAPYSAVSSPAGYTYQTFGYWGTVDNATGASSEYFFSTGAPTVAAALPATGTAIYSGHVIGSYVDAATRDPSIVKARMNATANFAALSVAFSTTGSTSLSDNAPNGTLPTAHPGLDMNGTLSYTAGSNTFTGAVSTANGMSGNATGRFYGPTTKAGGAPAEIGGTFAVMNSVGGAMQGAFGGK